MTYEVNGIDVSRYQAQDPTVYDYPKKINWQQALDSGIQLAIIRCGLGYSEDWTYGYNRSECERLGIPFGVYHAFWPTVDLDKQIQFFIDRIAGNLYPAPDIERDVDVPSVELSKREDLRADKDRQAVGHFPRFPGAVREEFAGGGVNTHLFNDSEWSFDRLKATYDAIEEIALNDLKLDVYPNQIEIISSEQMLDAYSSHGMPLMYRHWSFGKHFARDQMMYQRGYQGLAYEIVINSDPCIAYLMEENTMTMQALVMAHACFGHNHFFKNNYLFRQWTDAEGILPPISTSPRNTSQTAKTNTGSRKSNGFSTARTL